MSRRKRITGWTAGRGIHRSMLPMALLLASVALIGCPPQASESITILDPLDLEAHDIDLGSGLASIQISIDLTSSSGRPLQEGTFQAFVTLDIPGVDPDEVDELGNPIEQPIDITAHFTVDYQAETATITSPLDLAMGWYFLQASVLDDQGVEASDLKVFSVDYPGPLFLGSTDAPNNSMPAYLTGIHDECFNGRLELLWPDDLYLDIQNVPSFQQVAAAPFGLPVDVPVPPVIDPTGTIRFIAHVISNAIVFPPKAISPIDLSPLTNGLIPCEISFNVSGVLRRTGSESAAPRFVFQNVILDDSPSGGTCWVQPAPAGCQSIADFVAEAW